MSFIAWCPVSGTPVFFSLSDFISFRFFEVGGEIWFLLFYPSCLEMEVLFYTLKVKAAHCISPLPLKMPCCGAVKYNFSSARYMLSTKSWNVEMSWRLYFFCIWYFFLGGTLVIEMCWAFWAVLSEFPWFWKSLQECQNVKLRAFAFYLCWSRRYITYSEFHGNLLMAWLQCSQDCVFLWQRKQLVHYLWNHKSLIQFRIKWIYSIVIVLLIQGKVTMYRDHLKIDL